MTDFMEWLYNNGIADYIKKQRADDRETSAFSLFEGEYTQTQKEDMENISIFADRGLYIGVSSGTFYDAEAYVFSQETGEITRNEAYDKVNALFNLPLDPAKGDPEAAEAFLRSMEEEDDTPMELSEEQQALEDWGAQLEQELQKGEITCAERIESTVQTCKPDAEGYFSYSYDLGDNGGGSGTQKIEWLFPEKKAGTMALAGYSCGEDIASAKADVITLNEDGTVTFAVYQFKQ